MKYLYHVTDLNHANQILKEHCIKANIGDQSKQVNDPPAVYLCSRENIPIWQLILGKDTVLQIPIEDISKTITKSNYTEYSEFICEENIHSEHITILTDHITEREKVQANEQLCCSYLWMISRLCWFYARLYHEQREYPYLEDETRTILTILSHFDYSKVPEKDLKQEIEKMREECIYSFTDTFCNTSNRLWEQLILYPTDSYSQIRRELYDFIHENLKPILFENTGGYIV